MPDKADLACQDSLDARLKRVLRHLPAPVGIVTSFDPETGKPVGLAMSAIIPVSLEPPSMAIAVNRAGSAHETILRAGRFCINLLDPERQSHMIPFASFEARGQRFTQPDWAKRHDTWYIEGAPASIFCEIRANLSFGTHDLMIGEVYDLHANGGDELLGWANGALGRLAPLD